MTKIISIIPVKIDAKSEQLKRLDVKKCCVTT